MPTHARGEFDVTITPLPAAASASPGSVGTMSLEKRYHGDLDGTAIGRMLAVQTGVQGSAGYVAMEQVSGTLHGRTGTFVLQHGGTMTRGTPHLVITIVPDSGTDQLVGLAGGMQITITDGNHFYDIEYTIPDVEQ